MPDDSAAQIADSWRADIQWLGGWLRSHLRSDDSLLLLRGLVTIGSGSATYPATMCVHGTGASGGPATLLADSLTV